MKFPKIFLASSLSLAFAWAAGAEPISGTLPDGEDAAVIYAFEIDQARHVELRMSSDEIDSYLYLFAVGEGEGPERLTLVGEDDDGGGGLDSRIAQALEPGEYRLVARSFGGEGGPFEVAARTFKAGPIELLTSVVGDMTKARPAPAGGDPAVEVFGPRPAFPVRIGVLKAGRLQVDVLAVDDMDALLLLTDTNGEVLDVNDDALAMEHSRIIQDVTPGEYTAWVTVSFEDAPHVGEFLLNATFRVVEDDSPLPLREAPEDADDIVEWLSGEFGGVVGNSWSGEEVPGFELATVAGDDRIALDDLRGRMVLLDFWEPWCQPCLHTMPHHERLHRELQESHKLTVIGIVSDEPDRVRDVVERQRTSYLQLHDPDSATARAYGVTAIPRLVLVGPDGVALADLTGSQSYEQLLAMVNAGAQGVE